MFVQSVVVESGAITMAKQTASRDNVSCVKAFYVEEDAEIAERIVLDLARVNIRFYEEGAEGMAHGVYTTLLVFVSEAAAADPCLREEVETANANGKGVVVVYLGGTIPESLGNLLDYAEEFVLRPGGEEALLRRLATAHDMRACRKETLEPYEGPLDYIFISYAHKNSADVLPVVRDLQDAGFRIWYDAGIEVGSEWDAYIMDHVKGAKAFICFQSDEFRASTYCQQEIDCALECMPGAVVIACVNPTEGVDDIPQELRRFQGVLRHDCDTDKDFFDKLISAEELEPCRDEYRLSDDGKTLVKYLGGSAVVRIPEGVEIIGPRAVVTPNARKAIVPDGVTKVSEQAFIGCGLLEEVDLPDTVTEIGNEAFLGCGSLREIEIPAKVAIINESTFAGCVSLQRVSFLGEIVEDIMEHAFEDCSSLFEIDLPASIKRLWRYCFWKCSSLELLIPASVEGIAAICAFEGCKSVAISAENSTYSYRDGFLMDAQQKTLFAVSPSVAVGHLRLPQGIKAIYGICVPEGTRGLADNRKETVYGSFAGCTSLTSVVVPEGVTTIGDYSFIGCSQLSSVSLPATVEVIGGFAFSNCESITHMELPKALAQIGTRAFSGCKSLRAVSGYSEVKAISVGAFEKCTSLARIDIPETVESISARAFCGCESLEEAELPKNLFKLGEDAFRGCKSIKTIVIPASLKTIERQAFAGCSSLESVTMPPGVETIGHRAFFACHTLNSASLPESVKSIGDFAFGACGQLDILVPRSVQTIGSCAFERCRSIAIDPENALYSYDAASGLVDLKNKALISPSLGNKSRKIVVPDGIERLSDGSLDVPEVETITLPESIKSISPRALPLDPRALPLKSLIKHPAFGYLVDANRFIDEWKAVKGDSLVLSDSEYKRKKRMSG